MKSNEQQSPVDEYFRQRENEIPVAFNPDDWSRLAAMLDAAEKTDAPGLPQAPAEKSPRGRKGWWVSGVWILALVTVCWVTWQMAGNAVAETGIPTPAGAETGLKEYNEVPEAEKKATPEQEKTGKTNRTSGTGSAGETPDVPVPLTGTETETLAPAAPDMPAQAADSMSFRKLPVPPVDSAATPVKPEKKKKHLFW